MPKRTHLLYYFDVIHPLSLFAFKFFSNLQVVYIEFVLNQRKAIFVKCIWIGFSCTSDPSLYEQIIWFYFDTVCPKCQCYRPIGKLFRTCNDKRAVAASVRLWSDVIITFNINATQVFIRWRNLADKSFIKLTLHDLLCRVATIVPLTQ